MGVFFIGKNSKNIMDTKSGKHPQLQGNIVTTILIQWENAGNAENKAFCGFGGLGFLLFCVPLRFLGCSARQFCNFFDEIE
ncbi:hypothetical protein D3Z36_14685 [Lachnospiraceae bacterium]|nr:hypothetical protein [Lachnospiraceae bacterium]